MKKLSEKWNNYKEKFGKKIQERRKKKEGKRNRKWQNAYTPDSVEAENTRYVVRNTRELDNRISQWKGLSVLRVVASMVLCVSMVIGAFAGTQIGRTTPEIRSLHRAGVGYQGFINSTPFHKMTDGYLQLFQLYLELNEIVAEEGIFSSDKPLMKEIGDNDKEITIGELNGVGGTGYDYVSYITNYLNQFSYFCDHRVDMTELTETIRSLKDSMLLVEKDGVYSTFSKELTAEQKQQVHQYSAALEEKNQYEWKKGLLPDYGEEGGAASLVFSNRTLTKGDETVEVTPQNIYQDWIFQKFPVYAQAYMEILLAKGYEVDFKSTDKIDYRPYQKIFEQLYHKNYFLAWGDEFALDEKAEGRDKKKDLTRYVYYRDEQTGEPISLPDNTELYLYGGKSVRAKKLLSGNISGKIYSVSSKAFAEELQRAGEQDIKMLKEKSTQQVPWEMEMVPCSKKMAQDYADFLVDFYKTLKDWFQNSPFIFYYERTGGKGGRQNWYIGNGQWKGLVYGVEHGDSKLIQRATEETEYLYACYSSSGSVYQTNWERLSLDRGEDIQQVLKDVGEGLGRDQSYFCLVGIDMRQVTRLRAGYRSNELFDLYQWYQDGQEREVELIQTRESAKDVFSLAFLAIFISFVVLVILCGYRKGEKGIVLFRMDHLKLEFFLVYLFAAGYLFWDVTESVFDGVILGDTDETAILLSVLALSGVAAFLSLVRRWKAGMLADTSLIWKLFHKMRQGFVWTRKAIREQPAVRRYIYLLLFYLLAFASLLAVVYMTMSWTWYVVEAPVYFIWFIFLAVLIVDGVRWFENFKNAVADERICKGATRIAAGELSYQIEEIKGLSKEQEELIQTINHIGENLEQVVETSVRNERMKAELITNVSHDIKTPLTSVINYVDLLKRVQGDPEKTKEYLEVLDMKSQRLKSLIEDLVEASKASSGAIELQITRLNFNELVHQTNGEFEGKLEQAGLQLVESIPQEPVCFRGDGRRVYRILENLYNNVTKYAMPGTRVYVDVTEDEEKAVFSIKNISREPLNITAEELTERFVRGEQSRTTEGSGLGLSIAKSLTELMQGVFEIYLDGDLFRVTLEFPKEE